MAIIHYKIFPNKILNLFLFFIIASSFSLLNLSFSLFLINLISIIFISPFILKSENVFSFIYLIIFSVSIIFLQLLYSSYLNIYGSPYYNGGSDDKTFETIGIILAQNKIFDINTAIESNFLGPITDSTFYIVFLSYLYEFSEFFGEYSTLTPRYINVYLHLMNILMLISLLKKISFFSTKKLILFAIFYGFFPQILYINSHIFLETMNLFFLLLLIIIVNSIRSIKNFDFLFLFKLLSLFVIAYFIYFIRSTSIYFAIGLVSILIINVKIKKNVHKYLILSAILVFLLFFFNIDLLLNYVTYYSSYNASLVETGLSRFIYLQPLLPFGLILRAGFALISPFPNFFLLFRNTEQYLYDFLISLTFLGVILQIIYLPFLIQSFKHFNWLTQSFLFLFLIVISTTASFRHLVFYVPFMIALLIDNFFRTKIEKRKVILTSSLFLIVSLFTLYVVL